VTPRAWWARVTELFAAPSDSDLDEELRLHRDLLAERYEREGLSPDSARRQAALTLGGLEQGKEHVRDARGFPTLESLRRDLAHAIRIVIKAPVFASVTIVTLALGIAVNVAIFSIVDAVVLRPLPYPDADRLISIWETSDAERMVVAPGNLADYRAAVSFSGVAGLSARARNLNGTEEPETLQTEEVTPNYFAVLGVTPAIGRTFIESDGSTTSAKVAVLSDAFWRRRFGSDPTALGRRILLDSVPHEIVGVLPAGFKGLYDLIATEPRSIWVPAVYSPELLANRGDHEIRLVARLSDGATVATARAELTAIAERLAVDYPETNGKVRAAMQPLRDDVVRNVRVSLVVLLLTVAVILTIACVNVANLFLARGVARRREVALRFALGATRTRVVTTLVAESLVLATAAGVVGAVAASWITSLLLAVAPRDIPRLDAVGMDTRVLVYAAIVALATGLLFGAIPAWQAGHARPLDALAGSGRVVAGRSVMRWRNTLMTVQIALSALLLVGAGLMVKSLARLNSVSLGFQTSQILTMRMTLPESRYPTADARLQFFRRLEERLAAVPGIDGIAYANNLPLRGGWSSGFGIDGEPLPPTGYFQADFQAVSAGYFRVLGITLARGRSFESDDHVQAPPVAIVSRLFEQRFLRGESALGRSFRRGPSMPPITIVGVVDDVRRDGPLSDLQPQVYLHAEQTTAYPVRLADLAIRTANSTENVLGAVRTAVSAIDREQSISNVRTLDDILAAGSATQRFQALLFSMFALLALVLASVGTYGVVSYLVSQRTAEIGVRLALGASSWNIYRWLLGRTVFVVITGAVAGLIVARWLGRYVSTLLFEVPAGDPASYFLAGTVLLTVAVIASLLAGRTAVRIDPTQALRYD
jgi:putative ABC transport system permease protein